MEENKTMKPTNTTIEKLGGNRIQTVVSRSVFDTLTPEQIHQAFTEMFEKMKVPDPDNPNLWTIHIAGHRIWGILDEGAGENGLDLLTLIFPEDY